MTLHWWMHWFWVTLLTIIVCANTLHAAPQSEELQHITTDLETTKAERAGRAMYFTKSPAAVITSTTEKSTISNLTKATNETTIIVAHDLGNETVANSTEATTTVAAVSNATVNSVMNNATANIVNDTDGQAISKERNNLTRHPDDPKLPEVNIESRIVTEKPLSLETTYLHTRLPDTIESSRRVVDGDRVMDTGAIAGISFASLVLAALVGSTAFVLYRRRYLNKPQTLNDKCSNPDSSGYLDDSTIRDNSEEMYSLDNDSFLNSLEAMTIQNYWTDTVKHTKL